MKLRKPLNEISLRDINRVLKKKSTKFRNERKIADETWTLAGIPKPVQELRFDKIRRWRFDYAWEFVNVSKKSNYTKSGYKNIKVPVKVAVEVEGANPNGKSRHFTVSGYRKDLEKYNAAAMDGWIVL